MFLVADFRDGHFDPILTFEGTPEDFFGERIFDTTFDASSQRPGPVVEIPALVDQELASLVVQYEFQATVGKPFVDLGQFEIDDLLKVFAGELSEDDDFIEPTQELRLEEPLDLLRQPFLHLLVAGVFVLLTEPERFGEDRAGSGIGRHDQHDILEVDFPAKAVRQMPFFHDLQQHVVDIEVSLFDFVQQHDRIRSAPNLLGQLPALFEADVSRRCPDQPADVVFFHVLAHVDLDQCVLITEHEFCECLGEQRLADSGRPGEQKHTGGPFRVLQSTAAAANRLGNLLDRLVLTDHSLVQFIFHLQQPHRVLARKTCQRNPSHLGHDLGNHLRIDHPVSLLALFSPFLSQLFAFLFQLVGLVTQVGSLLEVLVRHRLFLGPVQPLGLFLELLQIRWPDHRLQPDAGPRLVDHVDRLIRQATAGDVAARQFHGRFESIVGDLHPVMLLVTLPEPLENLDGLLFVRRLDQHGLESPFQRPVLLDVLAVLIQSRCSDALQFATRKCRLEYIRGVDGAFGTTGSDQSVQFVDEQDRVLGTTNLVHHRLDPFFELAAILGAGDHHRQIQYHDAAFTQQVGHRAVNHHLGKSLDNRRLAHSRFTQQHRVVLLTPTENLDHSFDLVLAADHRVEFVLSSQLGQITTEAVQCRSLTLARLRRPARSLSRLGTLQTMTQQIQHLLADILELQSQVHQHLSRHTLLLAQQPQQQMLGANVVVVQILGLFQSVLDDLLGPRRLRQLAHRDHVRPRLHDLLDLQTNLPQIRIQILQDVGRNSRTLLDQTQQHVLGPDVLVVEPLSLLVGQLHHLPRPIGESLVHL